MRYTIYPIDHFEELEPYVPYTEWCLLVDPEIVKMYLEGDKRLYVALRDGMPSEARQWGPGYPYDSYGLSLLAIIVDPDGTPSTVATRWNSVMEDERYNSREALSDLLGCPLPF